MHAVRLLLRLSRLRDWIIVIPTVFIGYFLSAPPFGAHWQLVPMLAVFFSVNSFGYGINDYFDAPYDRLKPRTHNVISWGLLGKGTAAAFCAAMAVLGLGISAVSLPLRSFAAIAVLYLAFFVYSAPPFRLKEKAVLGPLAHSTFGTLVLVAAFLISSPLTVVIALVAVVSSMLSVIVDITQEVRDLRVDRRAGFRTTAMVLGYARSLCLVTLLFLSANALYAAIVVLFLPAYWLLLMASSVFYLHMLMEQPKQNELFGRTAAAWNRGMAVFAAAGAAVLLFHFGVVGI